MMTRDADKKREQGNGVWIYLPTALSGTCCIYCSSFT